MGSAGVPMGAGIVADWMGAMNMDWFDLGGKVALVTGAGAHGGLGHAMAVGLATAGTDVLIGDIDREGAEVTAGEIRALGRHAVATVCDNSRPDDIHRLFETLDREFGYIDILINNAGIGARKRPEDLGLDEWQRVLSISLTGTFLCSVEAGKRMMARGRGGSIINISSIAGSSALGRGNLVHSVAKSGVNQLGAGPRQPGPQRRQVGGQSAHARAGGRMGPPSHPGERYTARADPHDGVGDDRGVDGVGLPRFRAASAQRYPAGAAGRPRGPRRPRHFPGLRRIRFRQRAPPGRGRGQSSLERGWPHRVAGHARGRVPLARGAGERSRGVGRQRLDVALRGYTVYSRRPNGRAGGRRATCRLMERWS